MPSPATYDKVDRTFRRCRRALRIAQRRQHWKRVIEICDEALNCFADECLYPDDWAIFECAKEDARYPLYLEEKEKSHA